MGTTTYPACTDCCPQPVCSDCLLDEFGDPLTSLTVTDGSVSQTMTYDSGTGCWLTSFPNTLCGAIPGLPEENIIWSMCCVDGVPSLSQDGVGQTFVSWDCDPFEAVFGPVFDGVCMLTITP